MGRRVFISILGAGFYQKCRYQKDSFIGKETTFVQENLVQYLKEEEDWGVGDEIIMLLTELAAKNNWDKSIMERFSPNEHKKVSYAGLEKRFIDMGVSYKPVYIKDGKNTEEMWNIFEVIFDELHDGDQLYFDITNSFRYLPMLLLVLVNYAKLLKKVTVEAIYYGNYETRNTKTGIAPIMDLLPLSSLQDWTAAASDYVQYGQVDKLHTLSKQSLAPILRNPSTRTKNTELLQKFVNNLKEMVDERITCRGRNIMESKYVKLLETKAKEIQDVTIVQMKPVFEKIKCSLKDFDTKANVQNVLKAANWCFDNKLYQQATTLLEEGVITILCSYYELNFKEKNDREIISCCIYIATNETTEAEWRVNEKDKAKIKEILTDVKIWSNKHFLMSLTDMMTLRNDYNHAGFKGSAMTAKTIISKIKLLMDDIELTLSSIC